MGDVDVDCNAFSGPGTHAELIAEARRWADSRAWQTGSVTVRVRLLADALEEADRQLAEEKDRATENGRLAQTHFDRAETLGRQLADTERERDDWRDEANMRSEYGRQEGKRAHAAEAALKQATDALEEIAEGGIWDTHKYARDTLKAVRQEQQP